MPSPPLGGAEQVYRYLGRYTNRVAIANGRLVSLEDNRVRFRYKDYAHANRTKEMTLSAEEFIRRFLLHVLPKRFVRLRHYGLLAARNVDTKLQRCCALLAAPARVTASADVKTALDGGLEGTNEELSSCPRCHAPLRRHPFDAYAPPPHLLLLQPSVPAINSS